ncbi:hypothetical protein R6Q59_029226 [Mikania micrantha]|uniref:DUF4408 domain-containing protein n=1 Tax=Mikania micrantha TaxID=192012 RepID=A0A5N6LVY3_9ASTR|nr:hypothetical protein E3N88_39151 [Mikania micrantha]
MDIFDIHSVKMEKANAMLRYRSFSKIATLFRLVELFLAVAFFSWILIRLPLVIGVLSDYIRRLLSIIVSPLFIFLVGNVIIVTLVVKSGQITDNSTDVDNAGNDLYEQIANNVREDVPPVVKPDEVVYHEKRIVSESSTKPISDYCSNEDKIKIHQSTTANSVPDLDLKVYRRSQSDYLMKTTKCFPEQDKLSGKLKRSDTEIGRRKVDTPVEDNVVDKLSNEEFQRRIEGFIARQIRFHHEEKLAIVARMNT